MGLEFLRSYQAAPHRQGPYTHLLQVKIPSLGSRYDCRLPDLLLTMQYRLDTKGYVSSHPEPQLTFQPDGPNDSQLNFRHHTVDFKHTLSVCRFTVSMDALFGEGVVIKKTLTLGGTLGAEKVVKGEVQAGAELSQDAPATRITLHAKIEGMLSSKENRLECWGELV